MAVRAGALLRRPKLDRSLAEGREPVTPESLWRARQLTAQETRRDLAESLEHVLEVAEGRRVRGASTVPLNRRELRRCGDLVHELAAELVAEGPVAPRGMLKLQSLLRDGGSPLYTPSAPEGTLELELRHTRTMLFLL